MIAPSETPSIAALMQRPARLPSLTSLRFFVALAIFIFHVSLFNSPIPPYGRINPFADPVIASWFEWTVRQMGYLGVSFFFVLSGFVVTWATPAGTSALMFWRKRALKLFPNHVVVWALALALFAGPYTPASTALLNLALLHGFVPDPTVYVSVNPPAWSLVNDLCFYALFPILAALLRPVPNRYLWATAALLVIAVVAVAFAAQFAVPDQPRSPIVPVSATQFWFGYIFPLTRLFEFILGMIMARIVSLGMWPRLPLWPALLALIACYALSKVLPFIFSFNVATLLPLTAVICISAEKDVAGTASRFMRSPLMQKLGEISFGFYIVQGITVFYLRRALGPMTFGPIASIAFLLGLFLITLAAAWLLYSFVEQPIMDWGRRSQANRRRTSVTAST